MAAISDGSASPKPGSTPAAGPPHEQSRARYPDRTGYVEREGVRIFYEVYGDGAPTVLLMPTWSIVHSRHWKMQIPYLARHWRVITFDGRGNGRSDRPSEAEAYREEEFADDALAVLDATATERAIVVSLSRGAERSLLLAASHPERIEKMAFIAPALPLPPATPRLKAMQHFNEPQAEHVGWGTWNRHYWVEHYAEFLEFFFSQCLTEPHSTKPREDTVGWGLDTDAETLVASQLATRLQDEDSVRALLSRIDCPMLVIHGTDDAVRPCASGARLAELANAPLAVLEGSGHLPHARDPVKVNKLLQDFIDPPPPPRAWTRSLARRRRALYISSPIGLGHAQRDVAIADELRKVHPDLEIDWLAQHPVTEVLAARGERIHPASAWLASESSHIAAESTGHSLHAFQAIRRMDEILVANFMVFDDVVSGGEYDLVIGDEAWDVDYYLHENPELKHTAFAWLTDFVGWLPMPIGGEREAFVTADYNAEMIEHIARLPRVRDRAIFIGNPDDIVPDHFGPDLPPIRDWTERHFAFSGYVTGFDPEALVEDREGLRRELGYRPDERVVIVTVGGSGVGEALLRRVVAAYPQAARRVPGLRMIVVTGPRIEPGRLASPEGVEVHAFVPDLYRHLAASDLAVVQGGLTTTMELAAARRPFLYFPLANHFEQNRHVRYRLERYGAGRCLDFAASPPEVIADAMVSELDRVIDYRPVETDGATRAAALIAPLL